MGLEGIKLIACDLDGTLLHPGEREPRSEAFELIDELHRRGIVFMPASGRQYASLRYLFAPVADELAYVCENGALVIRVHPLSFSEYYSAIGGDKTEAFDDYCFYGGMPLILSRPTESDKRNYLSRLFSEVYLKDIVDRKKVKREDVLSSILDLLCSSVGSLTNPSKIANALNTKQKLSGENTVSNNTVKAYLDHLIDAFLFSECKRFDVKGKNYFDYPNKYYCEDVGLRAARIGFRQQELTHIMENVIYNELIIRECSVDIGIVYSSEHDSKNRAIQVAREIDFVASSGGKKTYIQSAYALPTEEKSLTENKPLSLTGDSFPKIIVRNDIRKRWYDENGILNIGVIDFLLDDSLV